ncbi:MAG: hypothetical protein IKJ58_09170, partial [Akkermansia sp.]|nr:hypothetical protein [Akkermansia sp.]
RGVLVLFFHTPIMSCNRAFPKHHFCHPVSLFAIRDNSCIRFLWDGNESTWKNHFSSGGSCVLLARRREIC